MILRCNHLFLHFLHCPVVLRILLIGSYLHFVLLSLRDYADQVPVSLREGTPSSHLLKVLYLPLIYNSLRFFSILYDYLYFFIIIYNSLYFFLILYISL